MDLMELAKLSGVTLVYGPAGAGKTTFAAWYVYARSARALWISLFEDEATFRRNMANLGYNFGDRLIFWEAPAVEDLAAVFELIADVVAKNKPDIVVLDSVTELISGGDVHAGLRAVHNLIYRLMKSIGADVVMTAERQVAEGLTYIADNVIELRYDIFPYGTVREMVVRKIRGSKAGYVLPYAIAEGLGFVIMKLPSLRRAGEVLKTGVVCFDETFGGLAPGAVYALIGPVGAGKSTLMLKVAEGLRRAGKRAVYLSFLGDADMLKNRYDVEAYNAPLDVEEFLLQFFSLAVRERADAVLIDAIDLMAQFFGKEVFFTVLLQIIRIAKASGVPVAISLAQDWNITNFLDAVAYISSGTIKAVKSPLGRSASETKC